MLRREEARSLMAHAVGRLAPGWDLEGECTDVALSDPRQWPSGSRSFSFVLRHAREGMVKMLGRRGASTPAATYHRAVSALVLEACRDGNSDPLARYLVEIGVPVQSGPVRQLAAVAAPAPEPVVAHASGRPTGLRPQSAAQHLHPRAGGRPSHTPTTWNAGPAGTSAGAPAAGAGASPAIQGSFDVLDLGEVTQTLALGGKSGHLVVSLGTSEGLVVFELGRVVHAVFAGTAGEQAFATLMAASQREPGGRFVFRLLTESTTSARTIEGSAERLLVRVAAELDASAAGDGGEVAAPDSSARAVGGDRVAGTAR
jgi:uncharacterized protein DUF4388